MTIGLERVLWSIVAMCAVGAAALVRGTVTGGTTADWPIPGTAKPLRPPPADLGDLVTRVVASDPFRLDRRPAELPFGAAAISQQPMGQQIHVAPFVSGIVGPPWRAVLEGVPGREGSVLVAAGDTLAGLRIVSVRRDSIVIQAKDTTWRLAVRKTW